MNGNTLGRAESDEDNESSAAHGERAGNVAHSGLSGDVAPRPASAASNGALPAARQDRALVVTAASTVIILGIWMFRGVRRDTQNAQVATQLEEIKAAAATADRTAEQHAVSVTAADRRRRQWMGYSIAVIFLGISTGMAIAGVNWPVATGGVAAAVGALARAFWREHRG